MAANQSARETPTGRTAKHIAYALIGVYGSGLLGIGIFAAVLELLGLASGTWFELLKSGFLILGGALSTVIGYYFGSRGIQEAEANTRQAEERALAAEKELQSEREERRRLLEEEAPTYGEPLGGESGLIDPDEYEDSEHN
ncbi:MAG: hypothetical protein O2909_09975 [Chloroflexi bacterium]|nr:hypothetical protein [Chloroflexota bacterium]MDA1219756.1 hypothetical protein [Chloroflexota bacterium]